MLKSALRDSFVYGVASVLSKGLAIFLLPLYTRVLSPGDYGAHDLLISRPRRASR
jgi:O-antigen/teichoic acid export membrane protein